MTVDEESLTATAATRVCSRLTAGLVCLASFFPAADISAEQLDSLFPFSCQVGQQVTVKLQGEAAENASALIFSDPRITAQRQAGGSFLVTVPADADVADCDVWCISNETLSNPRRFVVSAGPCTAEDSGNDSAEAALLIPLPGAVDGRLEAAAKLDWFRFQGQRDQAVVINCRSLSLDGSVNPAVAVFGPTGRQVAHSSDRRREPLLHLVLPADGEYRIRVSDRAYQKPVHSHYRLALRTGPQTVAAWPDLIQRQSLSSTETTLFALSRSKPTVEAARLSGNSQLLRQVSDAVRFETSDLVPSWQRTEEPFETFVPAKRETPSVPFAIGPRIRIVDQQVTLEDEQLTGGPSPGQSLTIPALLNGRFGTVGDADWYTFEAQSGESLRLDLFGDRLGHQMDLDVAIIDNAGKTLITFPDLGTPKDRPPVLVDSSLDVSATWKAPATGKYQLVIRDLYGSTLFGHDRTYALWLRRTEPSFRVLVNPAYDDLMDGYTIPRGGRTAIKFTCIRQDGFQSGVRIRLADSSRKAGFEWDEAWIAPTADSGFGILSHSPAETKSSPAGFVQFEAFSSEITKADASVTTADSVRNVRAVTRFHTNAPTTRLMNSLPIAITADASLQASLSVKQTDVAQGSTVSLQLDLDRGSVALQGPAKIRFPSLPKGMKVSEIKLPEGAEQVQCELTVDKSVPPGRYSLAATVQAAVVSSTGSSPAAQPNPPTAEKTADKAPVETVEIWSNAVTLHVVAAESS